ncbi:transporter [Nitrosophilus alvini]|uniref:transporter n=1 Tax=Nitrosophilus alvini TaxID=2714855 RepID=UPI00190D3BAF|nr:transporter [Nitrosophilus alvini]
MKKVLVCAAFTTSSLFAHHGVASLGVAGLEGPGAPVETTSSATLPEGKYLAYMKLDYASYENYTPVIDDETDKSYYWMYGLGYGFTPYLSGYVFAPYYTKRIENGEETSGFHDINLMGVLGFKYDEGFILTPSNESLDDLEDWHFTLFANLTLPTGNSELKKPDGSLYDAGMQLSFGEASYMIGMSATKWFGNEWTFVADTSYNTFTEHTYSDGTRVKFADEIRINGALTYKLYTNVKKRLRVDANLEANFLHLGRDKENGIPQEATGGDILYNTAGFRVFYNNVSAAVGLKVPVWTKLNEEDLQQGSEGKEDYRVIFSFSTLF